jgi:hypothetical protein
MAKVLGCLGLCAMLLYSRLCWYIRVYAGIAPHDRLSAHVASSLASERAGYVLDVGPV